MICPKMEKDIIQCIIKPEFVQLKNDLGPCDLSRKKFDNAFTQLDE
jgi:hypothetical protein